jgi:hypothetical protein
MLHTVFSWWTDVHSSNAWYQLFHSEKRLETNSQRLWMTPKRKIKAKKFVLDIRNGLGDDALMKAYFLTPVQLQKVFSQLVDAGMLDEMELYMRTSISDSVVTKAFVESQLAIKELDSPRDFTPPEVDPKAEIEFTEVVNLDDVKERFN